MHAGLLAAGHHPPIQQGCTHVRPSGRLSSPLSRPPACPPACLQGGRGSLWASIFQCLNLVLVCIAYT